MATFIQNVNTYMTQMKIKQTYVSLKTGIDIKKLSRILTGTQDVCSLDMDKIATALGKKMEFFLDDAFQTYTVADYSTDSILFYAGEPTEKQEMIAEKLVELVKNMDEIMSAKNRFINILEE